MSNDTSDVRNCATCGKTEGWCTHTTTLRNASTPVHSLRDDLEGRIERDGMIEGRRLG